MAAKIGKTPILLKRTYPGFVVNAIQFPILAAACDLVTSRIATAETVDQAVREGLKLSEMDIASALRGYMEEQKKLAMPTGRFKAFMAKTMRQITKSLHDEAALSDDKLSAHIVDTIKLAMLNAASLIVEAGITTPEVIEIALKSSIALRLPQTGPLESADLGGLDTFHDIFSKTLLMPVPKLILDALAKGHIGLKKECMNGIYAWTAEKAAEVRARRTAALFDHVKSQSGAAQTAPIRPAHTTEELLPAAAGIEMPSEMAIA